MGNIESCLADLPSQSNATAFGNDRSPPGSSFKPPSRPRVSSALTDWRKIGIKESQSLHDTMDSVKSMLEFLTGRPTLVKDMFHIGRYKKPEVDEPSIPTS